MLKVILIALLASCHYLPQSVPVSAKPGSHKVVSSDAIPSEEEANPKATLEHTIDNIVVKDPLNIAVVIPESELISEAEISFILQSFKQAKIQSSEGFSPPEEESSNLQIRRFNELPIDQNGFVSQDFLTFAPNFVVGPIKSADTVTLNAAMVKSNMDVKIISISNNKAIAKGNISIFGYSTQDAIRDILQSLSKAKNGDVVNYGILLPNNKFGSDVYSGIKDVIAQNSGFIMRSEFYDVNDVANINRYIKRLKSDVNKTYYYDKSGNQLTKQQLKKVKDESTLTTETKKMDILFVASDDNMANVLEQLSVENFPLRVITMPDFALAPATVPANICLSYSSSDAESQSLRKYQEKGITPSRFGLVLKDAIAFVIYTASNAEGFTEHPNFIGSQGEEYIKDNIVERKQYVSTIKNNITMSDENISNHSNPCMYDERII